MIVTLDEMKNYLRVDTDEDDDLITALITQAEQLCKDVLRTENDEDLETSSTGQASVMYCIAYLYQHREDADMQKLTLDLRSFLFGSRSPGF